MVHSRRSYTADAVFSCYWLFFVLRHHQCQHCLELLLCLSFFFFMIPFQCSIISIGAFFLLLHYSFPFRFVFSCLKSLYHCIRFCTWQAWGYMVILFSMHLIFSCYFYITYAADPSNSFHSTLVLLASCFTTQFMQLNCRISQHKKYTHLRLNLLEEKNPLKSIDYGLKKKKTIPKQKNSIAAKDCSIVDYIYTRSNDSPCTHHFFR